MKTIKFATGLFILLSVLAVSVSELLFLIVELLLIAFGEPYSEEILSTCVLNLPLVLYVFGLHSNKDYCSGFRKKFFEYYEVR